MKAAIEFNVSKDTLVEFLASKGFSLDDMQRDFKLSPDMYRVAQSEFQQDKAAKAKAPVAAAIVSATTVSAAAATTTPVETKASAAAVAAPVETKAAVAEAIAKVEDTKADEITFDSIEAAFDEPAAQGAAASTKGDDLKKIEGIGPKIAELFNNEGIFLFSELANTPVERMQEILDAAGSRYRVHNPSTWAQQAQMAANGQWDELKVLQDQLNGGKED